MRIHLDTDLGGDPDDACALASLLGWPDVELVGITTTIDPRGQRAARVAHCLELAERGGIPVAAGAEVSMTTGRVANPHNDERYWPTALSPRPSPPDAANELLAHSIDQRATIVAIGPCTNLARLEEARPGTLCRVPIVVMGGWTRPPANGLPAWGPEADWNVQWDTRAAELVATSTHELTLASLSATLKSHLRGRDLPRLRASGPLGKLLARQSEAHAADRQMSKLASTNTGLPDDLLNFHHDPVTCAVALDWSGAVVEERPLMPVMDGEVLRWQPDQRGRPTRLLVDLDTEAFTRTWLAAVEAGQAGSVKAD